MIDSLNSDLFVHFDDLSRAGLSKEKLLSLKNNFELRFEFTYYEYEGKQHRKSKKAIDLVIIANDSPWNDPPIFYSQFIGWIYEHLIE